MRYIPKQFIIEDKINYKNTFAPLMEELICNDISFICYVQGLKMIIIEPNSYNLKTTEDILIKYKHLNIIVKIKKGYKWIKKVDLI